MNVSTESDDSTARTRTSCAEQRAEHLSMLGSKNVLELCVGPSLKTLEAQYSKHGIQVTGNDLEPRWKSYYPKGKWIIGDARLVSTKGFDTVVVAPPLSKGCSGSREGSLCIDEVFPSYYDFLELDTKNLVLVLPGRTLSVKEDRKQLHKLLACVAKKSIWTSVEVVPLVDKVTKYVDVYLSK